MNIYATIQEDEMNKTIVEANKTEFQRKHQMNSLMLGIINEVKVETTISWVKFFQTHKDPLTLLVPPPKDNISNILIDAKGKEKIGKAPIILIEEKK